MRLYGFFKFLKLEYLAWVASDMVDKWVCETCIDLHPFDEWDSPTRWVLPGFMLRFNCPNRVIQRRKIAADFTHDFTIGHRHVQLTLKMSRARMSTKKGYQQLTDAQDRYLDAMLSGYETKGGFIESLAKELNLVDTETYQSSAEVEVAGDSGQRLLSQRGFIESIAKELNLADAETYQSSAEVKVAADSGQRLRFLLKTVSTVHKLTTDKNAIILGINRLDICPHLYYIPGSSPTNNVIHDDPIVLYDLMEKARKLEKNRKFEPLSGSCIHCQTDYTITATLEDMTVTIWKDFGYEGLSPDAPEWRSHLYGADTIAGLSVWHEPMSIKKLFEESDPAPLMPELLFDANRERYAIDSSTSDDQYRLLDEEAESSVDATANNVTPETGSIVDEWLETAILATAPLKT